MLFVAVAVSGFLTQKVCYRTPTIEEVKGYINTNMPYAEDLSVEEVTDEEHGELYKIKYTDEEGVKRVHGITKAKAWVWPFTDYDFTNN